jgi:anaerobic magnesium-protoporphyrin IX monomethyl ester cyclase
MPPWQVLLWVKFMEAVMQLRPQAVWRVLAHPDRAIRAAMRWYYEIGRKVWPYEVWHFLFTDRHQKYGPTLANFWRRTQNGEKVMRQKNRENGYFPNVREPQVEEVHESACQSLIYLFFER